MSVSERPGVVRLVGRMDLRAPARVVDVDLVRTDPATPIDVAPYKSLWCLSRRAGVPHGISFWDVEHRQQVTVGEISSGLAEGADRTGADPFTAVPPRSSSITVVICTFDRPLGLRRLLESLHRQSDPDFSILVVDNAPRGPGAAGVLEELGLARCRLVVEPRRGLSRARNRALGAVETDLVAWIDDDEVADIDWVRGIKAGFSHPCHPAAVCGLMLPAELESEAQVRFEQYGGFNKGRSISPEILVAGSAQAPRPLYPLPAIGSGGNMAFEVETLRSVGGFDPCLGAGTSTHGGEETRTFAVLLRSGHTVLHWPAAITWHFHRREMAALRRQFFGYSAGLTAFYASMVASEPRVAGELVRILASKLAEGTVRAPRSGTFGVTELPADFPTALLRARTRGLVEGALRYGYERLKNRIGFAGCSTTL